MNIDELGKQLQDLRELMNHQKQQAASIKEAADLTIKEISESHENEEKAVEKLRKEHESERKQLKAKADALMSQADSIAVGIQSLESAITVATECFKLASESISPEDVKSAIKSIESGESTAQEALVILSIDDAEPEDTKEQEPITATG